MNAKKKSILIVITILGFFQGARADVHWNAGSYELSLHGFIRPTYSFATSAVSSFGYNMPATTAMSWQRDNQVAATEAAVNSGTTSPRTARSTWTIGQSRFGIDAKKGSLLGRFEFDLVNFDMSSATTSIRPRLRIVGVSYAFNNSFSMFVGQDWDIISAAKPYTFNFVSLYFRSGNTGFMRPQVRFAFNDSQSREVFAWAIGAAGVNDNANTTSVERGVVPLAGIRFTPVRSKTASIGVAGFGSSVRTETTSGVSAHQMRTAYLGKIFGDFRLTNCLDIRTNFFGGQNAQSTGAALSLASASYSGNQSEIGGFLTTDFHNETRTFNVLLGSGIDHILKASEDRSGQLIQNWASRTAVAWAFESSTRLFSEATFFKSLYNWTGLTKETATAFQLEAGLVVDI
ncbi:MAG: hypothetical protein AB7F43_12765 [Bacteriovoracia bacterium]